MVDGLYCSKNDVSNYSAMMNDCRRLPASDLITCNIRFIRRPTNKVAYNLAWMTPCHVSFHIHIMIPSCNCSYFKVLKT